MAAAVLLTGRGVDLDHVRGGAHIQPALCWGWADSCWARLAPACLPSARGELRSRLGCCLKVAGDGSLLLPVEALAAVLTPQSSNLTPKGRKAPMDHALLCPSPEPGLLPISATCPYTWIPEPSAASRVLLCGPRTTHPGLCTPQCLCTVRHQAGLRPGR